MPIYAKGLKNLDLSPFEPLSDVYRFAASCPAGADPQALADAVCAAMAAPEARFTETLHRADCQERTVTAIPPLPSLLQSNSVAKPCEQARDEFVSRGI